MQAEQTGDAGVTHVPVEGSEVPDARFLLNRVVTYDGKRETLDNLGKGTIDPNLYISLIFAPTVDPSTTPGGVYLNLIFFEEGLGKAQVLVYQASSGGWQAFDVDVSSTDGQEISVTIDLSGVLADAGELSKVQVRFLAAAPKRAKAEVDSTSLMVALSGESTGGGDPLPIDPVDVYGQWPAWWSGSWKSKDPTECHRRGRDSRGCFVRRVPLRSSLCLSVSPL